MEGPIPARVEEELSELAATEPCPSGTPLRAVVGLTEAFGDLEPPSGDQLARRRSRAAARRLAARAVDLAVCVAGAFGDRPEAPDARARALADVGARAAEPGPDSATALGALARLAFALPPIPEEDDWQLGAIAFLDERTLRELYDACLTLAAVAVCEAATG